MMATLGRTLFVLAAISLLASAGRAQSIEYGTVTIEKTASESDPTEFDFTSPQLGDFTLSHGSHITFTDLDPGNYSVTEPTLAGWELDLVIADSSTSAAGDILDWTTYTFSFHLEAGERLGLTFRNEPLDPIPDTTTPLVPAPSALLLATVGLGLCRFVRSHRRL